MATTILRLGQEILQMLNGGNIPAASKVKIAEVKIAIGHVVNSLLKTDYFQSNLKLGEMIPNGSVLGYYADQEVTAWKGKSRVKLPIKPLKLPRDMGVWAVFPSGQPDKEIIPLQMGQWSLLQSQPLINDLLGQVGRETYGDYIVFTKDLTIPNETVTVDMRLVIMDIAQYDDYQLLPILPEQEWTVKTEVLKLYGAEPISDKLVAPSVKEQKGVPVNQQKQS